MTLTFDADTTDAGEIRIALVIEGEAVWPHPGEDDGAGNFDPEDVLSYLADAWPSLLLAQTWPISFEPDQEPRSISGLLRAAEDHWEQLGAADATEVEREGALVDEFLYHHDLSQMKHGADLHPCFVLRQQNRIRLETNREIYESISFRTLVDELGRVGSMAVDLLRRNRLSASAARVITRWETRDNAADPITPAALVSGLPRADIAASDDLRSVLVDAVKDLPLSAIANDNSRPELAAARCSGPLGPAGVADVLRRIVDIPDASVEAIAELRRVVRQSIRQIELPLDQGIRAANTVRDWFRQPEDERINLELLSNRLKIRVERQTIPDNRLDGIATSGPKHGPSILLNLSTRRRGTTSEDLERSLRFTWAHEIGHLLMDQDEWPAVIDAARQRVPRAMETRANAFSAYLLLRGDVAYRWWEQEGFPLEWSDLESLLNRLTEKFGLPRIAASRQLARAVPSERRRLLERVFRARIVNYDGRSD